MVVHISNILLTSSKNTSNYIPGYPRTQLGALDAIPND
jgi:hypothetical protein